MLEYKVLTQRDRLFSGNFDLDALETALNSCAAEGWRVVEGFHASSLWKSLKTEIVVILERSKS
jgi:hypothetical protein